MALFVRIKERTRTRRRQRRRARLKFQTNLVHTVLQVFLKTTQREETDEKMEKTFQC